MDTKVAQPGKVSRITPYASHPVLVKTIDTDGSVSHFHMPGDKAYDELFESIKKLGEEMLISFEEAAIHLGYEVGFAHEHLFV